MPRRLSTDRLASNVALPTPSKTTSATAPAGRVADDRGELLVGRHVVGARLPGEGGLGADDVVATTVPPRC